MVISSLHIAEADQVATRLQHVLGLPVSGPQAGEKHHFIHLPWCSMESPLQVAIDVATVRAKISGLRDYDNNDCFITPVQNSLSDSKSESLAIDLREHSDQIISVLASDSEVQGVVAGLKGQAIDRAGTVLMRDFDVVVKADDMQANGTLLDLHAKNEDITLEEVQSFCNQLATAINIVDGCSVEAPNAVVAGHTICIREARSPFVQRLLAIIS